MSNFEQCLLWQTKKQKAHSVSENDSFSTFRWITVQHCYSTLAEPSKFHQTFKLLSQFMALTALLCCIIVATRNKFVLIHFPQWSLQKQDVITKSNSTGTRHGPATSQKCVWVNEGMRTYQIITHLFTCLPSNLLSLSMPSKLQDLSLFAYLAFGLYKFSGVGVHNMLKVVLWQAEYQKA